MTGRTLACIIENFSSHGGGTAYIQQRGYRSQRWSYRQVLDLAHRFAGELAAHSILPGERIFIWGEDSAEWVAAFFGAVLAGAVIVPMDCSSSPEFARSVCRQVDARFMVCSGELQQICPDIPSVSLETLPESVQKHSGEYFPRIPVRPEDSAEIVFTSGTTAEPKGVVLSHENILANLAPIEEEIEKYRKYEKLVHPLRFLNLLPLSHMFGQYLGIFLPQVLGATVVFQRVLNPSDIIRSVKRHRVSVLVGVPRILDTLRQKLLRDLESSGETVLFNKRYEKAQSVHFMKRWWIFRNIHRRFGWKFWAFICGGARLTEETERFWSRLGFAVIQGYGLTETTSLISLNHPLKISGGTIGKVLPGREVRLSQDGEILVRGSGVAENYFQDSSLTPVPGENGWFATGDLGELDENGNLYFKGRRKNVIVSAEGMNIYPEDLEAALRKQPEIRDCIVVGVENEGNPEVCAVLLPEDRSGDIAPAVQSANGLLAEYQHIRNWYIWPDDDFPRTSTQKVRIGKVRDFARSQIQGIPADAARNGILPELIRQVTGRRRGAIDQNSSLAKDLDLSSIERVELLGVLEDRFQVDLNETSFSEAGTVADLEAMLSRPSLQRTNYAYPRWTQRTPTALVRTLFYYTLTWPLTHLMALPKIRGREYLDNLPGPVLFVSNHVTQVDVVFILAAVPPRYRYRLAVAMMGELLQEMRHPDPLAPLLRRWESRIKYGLVTALFNVFPLPQKTGFRESFRFAGESVDRGYSILVFPEGGRTKDGEMARFQTGTGILAHNLNVPVVPIRIDGLYAMKTKGRILARPGSVSVHIGPAVQYDSDTDSAEIAKDLESRVKNAG